MENQSEFIFHTPEENADILAAYFPNGKNFSSKYVPDTNMRKTIYGLAQENGRIDALLYDIAFHYYLPQSTYLLDLWEETLGIPDDCFTGTGTLEERRRDCIVKMNLDRVVTEQDYIDLAAEYGFVISLSHPSIGNLFPVDFPWEFQGTQKEGKFTVYVTFLNVPPPSTFPVEFPWEFGGNPPTNIIECLFRKIKPAPYNFEFFYNNNLDFAYIIDELGNFIVDEFNNNIIG